MSDAGRSRERHAGKSDGKASATSRSGSLLRKSSAPRKDVRTNARSSRPVRKPALTAGAKAGNSKRYGFTAPKKRG